MRWAIVGASDIAATQVIPALRSCGEEPAVVVSSNLEWAREYAAENGVPKASDTLESALAGCDAAYISSTNEKHYPQTLTALGAGLHVLCEKPIAMEAADAKEMVNAAAKAGVVIATNHHLRNSGVMRKMREFIADGRLGDLLGVRVNHAVLLPERLRGWRLADREAGGGVVLDITVHDVDTIRFVTGLEPTSIVAAGANQGLGDGLIDAVMTTGTLGDSTLFSTYDAFTVAHAQTSLEVHGTQGSLIGHGCMTPAPVGTLELLRHDKAPVTVHTPVVESLYVPNVAAFVAATQGRGAPLATGDDGRRSLQTALGALESLRTGQLVRLELDGPVSAEQEHR